MKQIIKITLGLAVCIVLSTFFWVLVLTPEKTLDGQYTDPFKYWTDDIYFQQHFNKEQER